MKPLSLSPDWLSLKMPAQGARIVVAMSGGVDSSVTAALLVEAGYEVVGLTLQLYDYGALTRSSKTCCAGIDVYDAKRVADTLGIPHYVLDYESRFKTSVIDDFVESYIAGQTPVPCIRCNQTVKFVDMYQAAKDMGAEVLATGHYVQWVSGAEGPEMHRALDLSKDQSYFLFTTTRKQLDFLRFPLGGLSKNETRAHATRFGLAVAEKPDSQDICFVPDGQYAQVVERFRPGALESGDIVHREGAILGRHDGIINYTVGQRKGLGVSSPDGSPLYVLSLDPDTHQVIVGPKEDLRRSQIYIKDINWIGSQIPLREPRALTIRFRSSQDPLPATVTWESEERIIVQLEAPEYGISKGQACVFYQNNRMLGGGWIEETA